MAYDPNNVFAKILRGEIPCKKVHESKHSLAFHDINPLSPIHVLVIPKGAYVDFDHFSAKASPEEQVDYIRAIGDTARAVGADEGGYRLLSNCGVNANQEVPHLHVHIFGGRMLGRMLKKDGE
jgi:histidine triad (HIT) family protein